MKDLILPLPMMFWSFAQIFLFCELGERLTEQFDEIDKEILNIEWYTFPTDVQKVILMVMNATKRPVMLCGIGSIRCTRMGFKDVRF